MIPDRIYLEGFLCYREPQEACFEGRTLWMLAGENGSGKSASLDAVTMTLFGQHRGGRHNARGLIHHACDSFALEFDFTLDHNRYRARRTLSQQGRSTRQLFRHQPDGDDGTAAWVELPDTHTERGFAQWIQDNIALAYETFTASVLLLQGKADNLLVATPADRHRLLCQIVGLHRFERIHQRAKEILAQTRGATQSLRRQVERLPQTSQQRLHQLKQATDKARTERDEAALRVDTLRQHHAQAARWWQLEDKASRIQHECDSAARMLWEHAEVSAHQRRTEQIAAHLDTLIALAEITTRCGACRATLDQLTTSKTLSCDELAALDAATADTAAAITATKCRMDAALACEKSLHADRAETTLALSGLRRLARARSELAAARREGETAGHLLAAITKELQDLAHGATADIDLPAARDALRHARENAVRAETELRHHRERLDRFRFVADSHTCLYCQQPLPESHVQTEETRLSIQLKSAEEAATGAAHAAREAADMARSLEQQVAVTNTKRQELEDHIQHASRVWHSAQQRESESQRQCGEAYDELPPRLRHKVAPQRCVDWVDTIYPQARDLDALQQHIEDITRRLNEANAAASDMQQLLGELLARQRQESVSQQRLHVRIQKLGDQIAAQVADATHLTQREKSCRASLPAPWHELSSTELSPLIAQLKNEQASLAQSDVGTATGDLRDVQARHDNLRVQLQVLRVQQDEIPETLRQSPHRLSQSLAQACADLKLAEGARQLAIEQESRENSGAAQRHALSSELRAKRREQHLWERLVALLGRDQLQHDLLQDSEHAIVDYANAILDRLAAGQLSIELRHCNVGPTSARKTLDLVARTADSPADVQDVAFLSGSQKFRVAVALSLAIGQFASNTRRPVQAVIIDEGFGCLDAVNRQVMIQELQNLRGYLERIVLVSHQDEFASAFPDGYRCERVDGTTRLTPFHR